MTDISVPDRSGTGPLGSRSQGVTAGTRTFGSRAAEGSATAITTSRYMTWLFVFACTLQLSLFGLLPFGFKFIGDAALIFLFLANPQAWLRSSFYRLPHRFALGFLVFSLLWILYSILLWGDLVSALEWGRRWVVAGTYFVLLTSDAARLFDATLLKRCYVVAFVASVVTIVAESKLGVSLPGVDTQAAAQGGILLVKVFNPGNFLVLGGVTLATAYLLETPQSVRRWITCVGAATLFFTLVTFRSWWVGLLLAIIAIFIRWMWRKLKAPGGVRHVPTLIFAFIGLLLTLAVVSPSQLFTERAQWILSARTELQEASGSVEYRLARDVSRLEKAKETRASFRYLGVGFVAVDSAGESFLGFSSETNDSGWVEVLLTGGYPAAFLLTCLFLFLFWKAFVAPLTHAEHMAGVALCLSAILLMGSSNPILWDFGFVPLTWVFLMARSRPHMHSRAAAD